MAKINILDSSIFNRIAAGEVVDRPYSVVKEFVENSIDSGATEITIEIEKGGKNLIRVSDNGSGIEKDDFRSAFLPHATSKISCVEDLDLILTLGFRGEALASIASVSKVTIKSRAEGCDCAYSITCEGGKIGDILPCARDIGTEITAESLFYNTPVRAKFLKTDKGEESEITNYVSRFILGNPNVAFKYYVDGKLILQSFGGGLEEAVVAVYGAQVLQECYNINATKHGITIRGYIGKPSFTKANRTYQSVFINGRYVVNNTISSAISNAFSSYLMKRQYPFYILFVDVPPEVVDVNVHPNKADVRFENNQVIYGTIYSIISAVLDGNASALEYVVQDKINCENDDFNTMQNTMSDINTQKVQENIKREPAETLMSGISVKRNELKNSNDYSAETFRYSTPKQEPLPPIEFHDYATDSKKKDNFEVDIFAENKQYITAVEQKAKQEKIIFENAKYCGCLFNTYLLYEIGDDCFLIDQHAAHERLLFDKIKKEIENREVIKQPMLVPYILSVNVQEEEFINANLDILDEIGFECEPFGVGCFKVSTVPISLQDVSLNSFFAEILKSVGTLKVIRLTELLRDKIAMTACKHAIKGGMSLSESEKSKLFEMLGGNMGLKCPHGRPVAVKLSKTEIEKMFKRII